MISKLVNFFIFVKLRIISYHYADFQHKRAEPANVKEWS